MQVVAEAGHRHRRGRGMASEIAGVTRRQGEFEPTQLHVYYEVTTTVCIQIFLCGCCVADAKQHRHSEEDDEPLLLCCTRSYH